MDGHLGTSEGNNLILGMDGMSQRASPSPSRPTTPGISRQNSSSALAGEASEVEATDMDDDDDGETPARCAIVCFRLRQVVQVHNVQGNTDSTSGPALLHGTLAPQSVGVLHNA